MIFFFEVVFTIPVIPLGINFEMACHRTDYEFVREYVLLSTYRHRTAFRHYHA